MIIPSIPRIAPKKGEGDHFRTPILDHFRTPMSCGTRGVEGGVGWGSYVRLLPRDRATASWNWGWGWGGAVTFASYCVTVPLRPGGGGGGGVGQLRLPLTA